MRLFVCSSACCGLSVSYFGFCGKECIYLSLLAARPFSYVISTWVTYCFCIIFIRSLCDLSSVYFGVYRASNLTQVSDQRVSGQRVSEQRVSGQRVSGQRQWHASFTSVSDTRHSPVSVTRVTHQCQWHASFTSVSDTRHSPVSVTRVTHQCQWHASFIHQRQWHTSLTSISDTRHSPVSVRF